MTKRTVKILGGAVSGSANATVKFGSQTIFSGEVTNSVSDVDATLKNTDVLCTTQIDMDFSGNVSLEVIVTSGTVRIGDVLANYGQKYKISGNIGGVYYDDIQTYSDNVEVLANAQVDDEVTRIVSLGSTEFQSINILANGQGLLTDAKNDKVHIDGRLIVVQRPPVGPWVYSVPAVSTMTCNVEVAAGIENSIIVPNT